MKIQLWSGKINFPLLGTKYGAFHHFNWLHDWLHVKVQHGQLNVGLEAQAPFPGILVHEVLYKIQQTTCNQFSLSPIFYFQESKPILQLLTYQEVIALTVPPFGNRFVQHTYIRKLFEMFQKSCFSTPNVTLHQNRPRLSHFFWLK